MPRTKRPADYYVQKIRQLDWVQLAALWAQIEAHKTPGWPAGKAFEHLVLRCFELCGARVVWPFDVPLGGRTAEQIDGMVVHSHLSCFVESKHEKDPVNIGIRPVGTAVSAG